MDIRRQSGATLALVCAVTVMVILVGLAMFYLFEVLGGTRELQNATDSGNLAVAKQALVGPTIKLQNGLETENFSAFATPSSEIDLLNYNRLVGQTLLVALNASAEGTDTAKDNATTLIGALHSTNGNISKRLADSLDNYTKSNSTFAGLAESNSTRMLDNKPVKQQAVTGAAIAYTDKGLPTNIYLDPTILPTGASLPSGTLSTEKSGSSGQCYINGYVDLSVKDATGAGWTLPSIAGATVNPGQQPHRIAGLTFQSSINNPVQAGSVPPNTFASTSSANTKDGSALVTSACAVVGSLSKDFPAAIPHGYIMVVNPQGDSDSSRRPSTESIYNNQLFTGIFIANNGTFSTDESQIQAWADYNNGAVTGQAPPTDGMFNSSGQPVSGEQKGITSLGGNGFPPMADYTNVQGPNANQAAAAMLPAFKAAYPGSESTDGSGSILTAVEKLKAEVMELYASGQTNGSPAQVATTGMRYFDHKKKYVAPKGGSPQFTRPGTVAELCNQANPNNDGSAVLNKVKQRMREIKPTATDAEMNEVLNGNTIDLGQTFYIWLEASTNTFRMTKDAPSWVTADHAPDGKTDIKDETVSFPTIGLTVDPVGESGFNQTLFADQPDPSTTDLGVDQAAWTPSSGFNNLLGKLTFTESVGDTPQNACVPDPFVVKWNAWYAQFAKDEGRSVSPYLFWPGWYNDTATNPRPDGWTNYFDIVNHQLGHPDWDKKDDYTTYTWKKGIKTCGGPPYFIGQN